VRQGDVDAEQLLVFADVTSRVREILWETREEISSALDLLKQHEIDETSCSCLQLGKARHCDSFEYFNPGIPKPSIYDLPRLHKNKIAKFSREGRFALGGIDLDEVSESQALVLAAARNREPVIDRGEISKFYRKVQYPLYFLDYETYSSAIPIIEGVKPQSQLPFQFSLHVKRERGATQLEHYEYLAEIPRLPLEFIEELERLIGPTGSLVSWHMSFENSRNREMAELYPEKAGFLHDISTRTVDLEEIFKKGYVDIRFGGSTSVKKVLPVLAPDLSYKELEVSGGTEAMDGWMKYVEMQSGEDRDKLRDALLAYCKLDTYAMVRIFDEMERLT
jgi:hypothetical protein